MYRFDGLTVLVIKTDVTHTVTHQTTHILPPAGTQNALGESHKKASTQQAARSITLLARCRRAHGARLGRWRSQKHRWWPSAGVSGGGRDLTIRADDPTSRGTTQPGPTTQPNPKSTILKLGPRPVVTAVSTARKRHLPGTAQARYRSRERCQRRPRMTELAFARLRTIVRLGEAVPDIPITCAVDFILPVNCRRSTTCRSSSVGYRRQDELT